MVIKEDGQGNPLEYRVLKNGTADRREPAPQFLAKFKKTVNLPNDSEYLYEKAMFSINNDALETRCVSRAGATAVPEIQAAREAFFDQRTYRLRGCENAAMFDGNDDTFFDAQSRSYCDMNCRVGNGCLRVDFGDVYAADALEIVAFVPDEPSRETPTQFYPGVCDYSADLRSWRVSTPLSLATVCDWTQDVVRFTVHNIEPVKGKKVRFSYGLRGEAVRYIRLPAPMDRIFSVQLVKDGKAIRPAAPFANNLQLPYREFQPDFAKTATFTLPPYGEGDYLAVAVNGFHGDEGYSCTLTWDEGAVGADRRAPEYKANMWEHRVVCVGANNTSFITLPLFCSLTRIRMPNDRVLCMSAWPMSMILASYLARMLMMLAVRPGRSSPVMRIRMSSSFPLPWLRTSPSLRHGR